MAVDARDPKSFKLDDFPFRTFDKISYGDTDRQGHVNNAVFTTFMETGRAEMLYDPETPLVEAGKTFVIANLDLHFVAEIHWPGKVDIGTGVTKIGNSSIGLFQAVFQDGVCVATANSVIVRVENGKSSPLSAAARTHLEKKRLA